MIVLGSQNNIDVNNMFDDEAYKRTKYFKNNNYDLAVEWVYKQLRYMFKEKFNEEKHFKFDINKSMEDIRRIQMEASDLDYDDYYDLVTLENCSENYLCDLVIFDGKMGLRYSYMSGDEVENLDFEPCEVNLDNEVTLMLDMQEKLNNFIDKTEMEELENLWIKNVKV